MIKLGDKPLADMTAEEMIEAVTALREAREALRAEAIKKKRDAGAPREPSKPKEPKVVDPFMNDMLTFLQGEKT